MIGHEEYYFTIPFVEVDMIGINCTPDDVSDGIMA